MLGLAAEVFARWRGILVLLVLTWAGVTALKLSGGRAYETSVDLVAVPSVRGSAASGGLAAAASLLSGGSAAGMQTSPVFIAALAQSRSVLDSVGRAPVPGDHRSVIEHLLDRPISAINAFDVAPIVRRYVSVAADRNSGIISVRTHHSDSVVARTMATALLAQVQRAYRAAMQTQASEQRMALNRRVDSAAARLQRAEDAMLSFSRGNRETNAFATSVIDRQRLQRNVELAQTVYQQAMSDRESAVARELEEAPAVAVIDPVPAYATPLPRHLGLSLVASTIVVTAVAALWIMLVTAYRNRLFAGDAGAIAMSASLRTLPVVGRFAALPDVEHQTNVQVQ